MTTPLYIFTNISDKYLYLDNQTALDIPFDASINNVILYELKKQQNSLHKNGIRGWELNNFCDCIDIIFEKNPNALDCINGKEIRRKILEYIGKNNFSIFFARNINHKDLQSCLQDRLEYKNEIFQS